MTDDNADYITLVPVVRHGYYLVCVMKWHKAGDEFIQARVSHEPLKELAAEALALSWSRAMKLEVRR